MNDEDGDCFGVGLEGLEDIDWDEDWSEIEMLCGSESLCCVDLPDRENDESQTTTRPSRFKKMVNEKDIEKAIVLRVPKNTSRSTNWGVGIFQEWCKERMIDTPILSILEDELDGHLSRFVHEVVKKDGETPYPPNSLHQYNDFSGKMEDQRLTFLTRCHLTHYASP